MAALSIGITGAAGFIGRHLVRRAHAAGQRVLALARGAPTPGVGASQQLTLPDGLDAWQPPFALDALVHLACNSSVRQPLASALATVRSTEQLLRRCAALGVPRFVYVSSVAVFGTVRADGDQTTAVDEGFPARPESDYGRGKLMAEELCRLLAPQLGVQLVIARPASVYGPDMHVDSVLPIYLQQARAGRDLVVFGSGNRTQDFVHVDDIADALLACCTSPLAASGTFNLGSGEGTSLLTLAEALCAATGSTSRIVLRPERPDDGLRMVLDVTAARTALGYAPMSLRAGLARFLAARESGGRSPSGDA